jgi:hypothetical protein
MDPRLIRSVAIKDRYVVVLKNPPAPHSLRPL